MAGDDLVGKLQAFNRGRDPERLALKYRAMRADPFAFFRGTAHLFHEAWDRGSPLNAAPLGWLSGDLHLENFGSFRGDNGLAYFDLNDFDEAALAPVTRDLARFLASLYLAGPSLHADRDDVTLLAQAFLAAYRAALLDGRPRWVERSTAHGAVRRLLRGVRDRTRADLIRSRARRIEKRWQIIVGKGHALPADDDALDDVSECLARVPTDERAPRFYEVVDVARRIAGIGSLGVERYAILARGTGDGKRLPGMILLDLKEAGPSVIAGAATQPMWKSEAERVVTVQRRVQAAAPALLRSVRMGRRSFVLRELQPTEDRLALARAKGRIKPLRGAITTMAEVVAWGHLRSGGRQGSAIADEWIAFAEKGVMVTDLLALARQGAKQAAKDWDTFSAAFDRGAFELP